MCVLAAVDKIIELESLERLTVEEYMSNLKYSYSVIRWINTISDGLNGFKYIITAAYGLHNNKYLDSYYKLSHISENIESNIISMENISELPSITGSLPISFFKLNTLCECFKSLKPHIENYLNCEKNALEIHKLALRYTENNTHSQTGDDGVSFLTIENLDGKDHITETNYKFNGWEQWSSTKLINKTDADKWPILKSVYPEQYI